MEFICEAHTGGGPVAIMTLAAARNWSGCWGDYFRLIGEHQDQSLQFFEFDARQPGFLFRQVDDGDYVVYSDKYTILILNETYAPDRNLSLRNVLPNYEPYIVPVPPMPVPDFGGQVVLFDSVYPGHLITLSTPGHQTIGYSSDSGTEGRRAEYTNAVLVEVDKGAWQARTIHRKDKLYCYDGALFQRKEGHS